MREPEVTSGERSSGNYFHDRPTCGRRTRGTAGGPEFVGRYGPPRATC